MTHGDTLNPKPAVAEAPTLPQHDSLGATGFFNAMTFVNNVKRVFRDQEVVYRQFLATLHDYALETRGALANGRPLTETDVYRKVHTLFRGHDDLWTQFNQFMSIPTEGLSDSGPHLEIDEHVLAQGRRYQDALDYLHQVKQEFSNQIHVYKKFMKILKKFSDGRMSNLEVISRVISLFSGKIRLIEGFTAFLPEGYTIDIGQRSSAEPGRTDELPYVTLTFPLTSPSPGQTQINLRNE